jgi:amino acid adenylation domain-containing protein
LSQNVEDIYPLTPLQEGMLFHTLEAPGSGVYIERLSCELRGDLDPAAFRRAWEEVLALHPVLRTAFLWQGLDRPMQVVRRTVRLPWLEEDWRHLAAAERETSLEAFLEEDLRRGFDVVRPPLLRLALLRTGDRAWRLVWTHHHMLLDGWGRVHVLRDVMTLYEAARRGISGAAARPAPVRPFRDYVAWLRAQDLAATEGFWRRALAGFTAPTPLPGASGRAGAEAGKEAADEQGDITLELTAGETAALQGLARGERITLNTLVQAAWAILLARGSGEDDVVYGSVVSGRPPELPGAEAMVGSLINTLPVRVVIHPKEAVGVWLRRFQEELAAQRRFEHTPLVQTQAWSEVPRGTPLFETLVVFENHPTGGLSGSGSAALEIADPRYDAKAHYPLSLAVIPVERLALRLRNERARIDDATAGRLLARLRTLLLGLAADAERPLASVPLLPEEERREVLAWTAGEVNGVSPRPPLPESTIPALVIAHATDRPDRVAVEHDGRNLTYGEFDRRSSRLSRRLRALGAGPEVCVGLFAERSPELIVGMLAILRAGSAYVPLDPDHPTERLSTLLRDTGATLLVFQEHLVDRLPPSPARALAIAGESTEDIPELPQDSGLTPDHLAFIIFTSGSTGIPKGVAVTHRNVINLLVESDFLRLEDVDVTAQVSTPAFDAATLEIWGALLAAGRTSIVGRYDSLDSAVLARRIRETGVTSLFLTTALLNKVVREVPDTFAGLRNVLFGGEAVDPGAVRTLLAAGAPERLVHCYGPTECTTMSTWQLVHGVPPGVETVPIGGPVAGAYAVVLDRWGGLAPAGTPGELCMGGGGITRGYLGRPDLTAERFVPDPLSPAPGARLYRSGDLVRWRRDGTLEFLGRTDHQVKIRGFRVEPGEVEAVLREQPGVREALVAALPDSAGGRRLVAWWVRRPGGDTGEGALRAALRERLPEPMVPSAFVELPELPMTRGGKIDRARLPLPEAAPQTTEAREEAPRSPLEELIAGIEAAVLGRDRVGVHDSFLDLGGHSLLATQVVSRIRESCGVELPLTAVFEEPTVAGLAARVEILLRAGRAAELPPLRPVPRGSAGPEIPLSFAQERLWLLDQIDPGTPAYNVPLALCLAGKLDIRALAGALAALIARHESLRTRFAPPRSVSGQPTQIVDPPGGNPLTVVDLSSCNLPDTVWNLQVHELSREEAARRFDLAAGPLLRTTLLRRGPEESLLLLTLHHIVSDGWSMGVLLRDVGRAYGRLAAGEPAALPVLRIQYPDFAIWQRGWLAGEPLRGLAAFWREELAGAPPRTELPTDRPWPAVQTFRGATLPVQLPADLAARLRVLARSERVTPFMVLSGGLAALLGRLSGQDDLLLGTPIANRTQVETEELIGFFVNTLVLRLRPGGDLTVRRFLERVRATTLAAYAHQDLPFEKLVEELQPQRDLSLTPFFQVLFALQNAPLGTQELPGLILQALPVDSGTAKFALTLSLIEGAGADSTITGGLEYNRDLFDDATARRLAGHLETLLAGLVSPGVAQAVRLGDLPLLTVVEVQQLLGEWSTAPAPCPAASTLPELFAAQAARTPDAPAVLAPQERLSYAELAQRVSRLASSLHALGAGPERRVGLLVERGAALPVAALAILASGSAYVPLDPTYPRERLAFMLRDSGAVAVVVQDGLQDRLPGDGEPLPTAVVDARGLAVGEGAPGGEAAPPALDPLHLAYVIYTSGSTGLPKGVAITHASASALLAWAGEAFSRAELAGVLAATSVCFDLSVFELFVPLVHGGAVVLAGNALALTDLPAAAEVTLINTVPSAAAELLRLEALPSGALTVNLAGEPLSAQLTAALYEQPQVRRVLNLYGPSEDTTYSTAEAIAPGAVPTLGRPVAGARAYVLGSSLHLLPAGAVGELCLGGAGLARGYIDRPALTAERFLPDPFAGLPGARLYRTGDLARWLPDGRLEFLGRRDHQVKVRGFRIELGEIETRLAQHPAVGEAAVLAPSAEDGQRRLVAYTAPRPGREIVPGELRAFLRESLPEHMVPAEWVALPALPLTPSGKVDRRALQAPGAVDRIAGVPRVPPRTELERTLAEVWSEALGIDGIGVHDSFFDLGGHSLLLARVFASLRTRVAGGLTLVDLFRFPTIASLAEHLGRRGEEPTYAHTQERARKRQEAADLHRREAAERRRRVPGREPGR